jgi:tetratricopeptide (TPR) repeat protein
MTTTTANFLGQVLGQGRYRVTAKLGEGGMGFVYKAHDLRLSTEVVIKVPRLSSDPEFAARFTKEIRALVLLSHPHIVKVNDVGIHEELPFAVMQFLAGGSLADRQFDARGKRQPQELGSILSWLEDIASALDFMHRKGFVHRDVKPANILFDEDGNVFLSDFGIAKVLAEESQRSPNTALTTAGTVLGTPEYMAPEVILGNPYDGRADQYALGIMLYELLAGRLPFEASQSTALLVKHTAEEPKPLTELAPHVPPTVAAVVHRALAKNPAQRFRDCAALAQTLLEAAAGTAKLGAKPTVGARVRRVSCPSCGRSFPLPPQAQGRRLRCPACKESFQAPDAGETKPALAQTVAEAAPFRANRKVRSPWVRLLIPIGIALGVVLIALCAVLVILARRDGVGDATRAALEPGSEPGGGSQPTPSAKATAESVPPAKATVEKRAGTDAARKRLDKGIVAFKAGDLTNALAEFEAAAQADPQLALAHYHQAAAFRRLEEYEKGVAAATEALRLDPELIQALVIRGDLNLDLNRVDQGMADCQAALRLDPKHPFALAEYGVGLVYRGDLGGAKTPITDAVKLVPEDPEVAHCYAWYLWHAEKNDEAFTACERAARLDPAFSWPVLLRARIRFEHRKEFDLALEDCAVALKLCPRSLMARRERASIYLQQGKHADALAECGAALRIREDDEVLVLRAAVFQAQNDPKAAVDDVNQAIKLKPDSASHLWARARLHQSAKNDQAALSDLTAALKLCTKAKDMLGLYQERGDIHKALGDHERAIADYTQAAKLDPTNSWYPNERGIVRYRQKNWDLAIADFTEAIRLKPEDTRLWRNRADAYEQKGDLDSAIRDRDQVVKLNPKLAIGFHERGLLYYAKEDYGRAASDARRAVELEPQEARYQYQLALSLRKRAEKETTLTEKSKTLGDALTHAGEALKLQPAEARYHNQRALIYLAFGRNAQPGNVQTTYFRSALVDYNEAIRLEPNNATYIQNRSNLYDNLGDAAKSKADQDRANALRAKQPK